MKSISYTTIITILFFSMNSYAQTVSISSSALGNISCLGNTVTFTAIPSGLTSPTYQWYKNSVAISGATSSTYSTTSLATNDQVYVKSNAISGGTIPSSGLLFNLDAGNSTSYSGSGSTWNDISGNNNNTTLYNSPAYSNTNGGSLVFNGTSQFGLTPNTINSFSQGTFIAWIKRNGSQGPLTSGYVAIIYSRAGDPVGLNIVDNYLSITWGSLDYKFTLEGLLIPDNTWCMVALSASASPKQTTAYLFQPSGLTTASISPTLNPTTVKFKIGVDDCCARYFNGNIGQALTYNIPLTSAQIQSIYNVNASRFGLTPFGTSISSNTITTTINPLPSVNITLIGDACVNKSTLSTATGFSSYSWLKDNTAISGSTNNTYLPIAAGDYKVQVSNGTCSNTSTPITIYTCGVTADGKTIPVENSTTLVSKEGAKNNGKGLDERGLIIDLPIPTVVSAGGRIWMDRNLGATRVATSVNDALSYGDLYQWGRGSDGHQIRTSSTSSTSSNSDSPGNNLFIKALDWRSPKNDNLWQGISGTNSPCPSGFRLPTKAEWITEYQSWGTQNEAGAFASPLKLPSAGYRDYQDASISYTFYHRYWTSTTNVDQAESIIYDSGSVFVSTQYRANGMNCRCIKN